MTDAETMRYLISIAQMSGVFIAFGVLIGATQSSYGVAPEKKALAQAVSMTGIVSLLGAPIPILLITFGLTGHTLWLFSTIGFEIIILFGFISALGQKDFNEFGPLNRARFPVFAVVYWATFTLSQQSSLLLILSGVFPEKGNALYLFAQWVNLAEAAIMLTILVFHKESGIEQVSQG